MPNFIQKMVADKKAYHAQLARVEALPEDYRFVFKKIQGYIWSFAGGDGYDMLKTQSELLELLESGAAQGRCILDVTGEDVAGFCDGLIRDNRLWTNRIRERLNHNMKKKCTKSIEP